MSPTGREKKYDDLIMIRMTSELRKRLEQLAADDRRTLAEYCRLILEDYAEPKRKTNRKDGKNHGR